MAKVSTYRIHEGNPQRNVRESFTVSFKGGVGYIVQKRVTEDVFVSDDPLKAEAFAHACGGG